MIDIFGSKNLNEVLNDIYGSKNIGLKILSSTIESQYSGTITPNNMNLNYFTQEEKEIIEGDFRKRFRRFDARSDTIIIDLLSEKHTVAKYKNKKITLNTEVKKFISNENFEKLSVNSRVKVLSKLLDLFANDLNNYDNVIVCKFYLANKSLDEYNRINVNKNHYNINITNALLKTMYDYLEHTYPSFTYLEFDNLFSIKTVGNTSDPGKYCSFSLKSIQSKISEKLCYSKNNF